MDTLPANLVIAAEPALGGTCPGGTTAAAGATTLTYPSGAGDPPGGCTIKVDITSATAGSYTNLIAAGALADQRRQQPCAGHGGVLVVRAPAEPGVLKSFSRGTINPGGVSRLTLSLSNDNPGPATLSAPLVDTLPDEVRVAADPAIGGTCGGLVTALPGGRR